MSRRVGRSARRLLAVAVAVSLLAAVAGCSLLPRSGDAPLVVGVDGGRVQGMVTGATRVFHHVPFAAPPVGALRWRLPQPVVGWDGVRGAQLPGPACAQQGSNPLLPSEEDCLHLDVTTPRQLAPGARLPVMVWWHGGGFSRDSASYYDAQRLADLGQVVVVTPNYRLGVFGYLGLPDLPGSGNFGFADQIASLEWVQRNAAAFGGDPGNVTLFGQSAGAMSACALLTSPGAGELVDRVALSSGSCQLSWPAGGLYPSAPAQQPYRPLRDVQAAGSAAAHRLGCPDDGTELACLRARPTGDLTAISQDFANHLAHGTELLPTHPATAVERGDVAPVPVLSGGTRDEARSFVGGAIDFDPGTVTAETYPTLLERAYGDDADAVERQYPLERFGSAGLAWATVLTDQSWACPTVVGNRQLAEHVPVYPYEFADPAAPDVNQVETEQVPQGAAHASELPSLFDLLGMGLLDDEPRQALSARMIRYWTSFAATGDPNHDGAPRWPRVAATGEALQLAPGDVRVVDVAERHRCDFWAGLG